MRAFALAALLAYAFVGTNSAGIWCFGADGHVAFERLDAEHPLVSDSTAITLGARATALSAGGGWFARPHGPCFDVALDPGSQWHPAARVDGPHDQAPAATSTMPVAIVALPRLASTARDLLARSDAAIDRALTPVRSTVLRI
jgi:hypothetical protein